MLSDVFTEQITKLPKIVVPGGVTIYLAKAETQVVYFLTAAEDLDYPAHAHAAQFAVVLEGCIEITTSEGTKSYGKGDRYCLPAGMEHCAKLHAGFAEMSIVDEPTYFDAFQCGC
jgi:quercetin dioxygenase-like cupin family protein